MSRLNSNSAVDREPAGDHQPGGGGDQGEAPTPAYQAQGRGQYSSLNKFSGNFIKLSIELSLLCFKHHLARESLWQKIHPWVQEAIRGDL